MSDDFLKEHSLSSYGELSKVPSPVNLMMNEFSKDFRKDCDINLGVGYVNEDTIPRQDILEALSSVVENTEEYPFSLNYGGAEGSLKLITSIKEMYQKKLSKVNEDFDFSSRQIVIGANGASSILEGLANVLNRGIVVTSDPQYYIYSNFLERFGFTILPVKEDDDGINLSSLREKIEGLAERKKEISFIYIVSVSNPTSTILPNLKKRKIIEYAKEFSKELGKKVPVIFDKAYEELIHDQNVEKKVPAFVYDDQDIVYEIGTLSKILAPALRIGYIIGPKNDLMNALMQRVSDVGFSAPLILQDTSSILMKNISSYIDNINKHYQNKALKVRNWIDEYLADEIEDIKGGKGGFYYYLTFKTVETHENSLFFKYLTRKTKDTEIDLEKGGSLARRVYYLPGEHCVHKDGDLVEIGKRQLRISYAFESEENIKTALMMMGDALKYANSKLD